MLNGTTWDFKNLEQYRSQHSLCCILEQVKEAMKKWGKQSQHQRTTCTHTSELTCILCLSITAAESSLIGRGVLFTTTRRIHCSKLKTRILKRSDQHSHGKKSQKRGLLTQRVPRAIQVQIIDEKHVSQRSLASRIPTVHTNSKRKTLVSRLHLFTGTNPRNNDTCSNRTYTHEFWSNLRKFPKKRFNGIIHLFIDIVF